MNVKTKMPTGVCILLFMSRINVMSMKKFNNLGARLQLLSLCLMIIDFDESGTELSTY